MSELTPEAQRAIDVYLAQSIKKWGTLVGVVNLMALAAAACYIFFILPSRMASEAASRMDDVPRKVQQILIDATVEVAKAQIGIERALAGVSQLQDVTVPACQREVELLKSDLRRLAAGLDAIESSRPYSVAAFRKLVDDNAIGPLSAKLATIEVEGPQTDPRRRINVLGGLSSRGTPLITDLAVVVCPTSDCRCEAGWEAVPRDLNSSAGGDFVRLCVKRAS